MIGTAFAIAGWILLALSLLAYGGQAGLNLGRLARWRKWYALGGVALMVLAFPLQQAVVFGAGFTAMFASIGPLFLEWRRRREAASEASD